MVGYALLPHWSTRAHETSVLLTRGLWLSLVAVSLAAHAGATANPSARPSSRALPDCLGQPIVKPKTVVFACGDGNFGFDHLTWVVWGRSRALALGSGYVNDCEPDCAAGHFTRYRAVLIATGSQRCRNGQRAYLTVTYAFVGRSPFPPGASGTFHPWQSFRCRKGGAAFH